MKRKGLFLTTVLGCLFLLAGCGKITTDELLKNTLTDDMTAFDVKENISIDIGLGDPSEYRLLMSSDTCTILLDSGDGIYGYREGTGLYSVTNYKKIDRDIADYYVINSEEESYIYSEKNKWYKKELSDEKIFNKSEFLDLFKDTEPELIASGEKEYYKLEATLPMSECSYLCDNEFLELFKDAMSVKFTNYYDKKTKTYVMTKAFIDIDSDKMVEIYKNEGEPFGYEILGFGLSTNEIKITPVMASYDVLEGYKAVLPLIEDSSLYEGVESVKNAINTNTDGYYLDDDTFSISQPTTKDRSWEYKENGEVILVYDKDTNTLKNVRTGEETPDYIKSDAGSKMTTFVGEAVEEETLRTIWESAIEMDINFDMVTLVGSGMKEEFYESDFAKAVNNMFYNMTIRELITHLTQNDFNENELYAYVHLCETRNVGLYTKDDGSLVTYKDLYILCGHTEKDYNALKEKYLLFIGDNVYLGEATPEE